MTVGSGSGAIEASKPASPSRLVPASVGASEPTPPASDALLSAVVDESLTESVGSLGRVDVASPELASLGGPPYNATLVGASLVESTPSVVASASLLDEDSDGATGAP